MFCVFAHDYTFVPLSFAHEDFNLYVLPLCPCPVVVSDVHVADFTVVYIHMYVYVVYFILCPYQMFYNGHSISCFAEECQCCVLLWARCLMFCNVSYVFQWVP